MLPSLTFLAEHLVNNKLHTNFSWAITVTERVALIAVEWYRQVYVYFKMWKLNSWIYYQFERLGGKLACILGNKRNCDDFFALLRKVYWLCPLWFSINWQLETEVLEEKQSRSMFIGFDPWHNEYLQEVVNVDFVSRLKVSSGSL
eukprot:IDg7745t1